MVDYIVDYIVNWDSYNKDYKFSDIISEIKPENDLLHHIFYLLNIDIPYESPKKRVIVNLDINYDDVINNNRYEDTFTNNVINSINLLYRYIIMIKNISLDNLDNLDNFDNPIVINNIGQKIWIIIKSIGLRFVCFDDILYIIESLINNNINKGYLVIDCNPLEKLYENDPDRMKCGISNYRTCKSISYQLYTCGRAIYIETDSNKIKRKDLPKIIVYNSKYEDDDNFDENYKNLLITLKYKQKYLKYKQKYLKLKQSLN